MASTVLLAAAVVSAFLTNFRLVHALFSVHDDILAFPQFEVSIFDSYYTEEEAAQILSPAPKPSAETESGSSMPDGMSDGAIGGQQERYEAIFWDSQKYLCTIPTVQPPPPMNATEKEIHRAEEEKELARATTRGWELLSELDGKCLYFISGWWSYSFCYNKEIRQFHQLPPENGVPLFPPAEDPATPSYVLGRVTEGEGEGRGAARVGAAGEGTELQGSGGLRYLVQKLGGGTICDLTEKERRVEVQYHCNPSSSERIAFVKEISICCYLMVIYTPRLCNDVAFLPPQEGRTNVIECKAVMNPAQIEEWNTKKRKEERLRQIIEEFEKVVEDGKGMKGIGAGKKLETQNSDENDEVGEGLGGKKIKLKGEGEQEYLLLFEDDLQFLVEHEEL